MAGKAAVGIRFRLLLALWILLEGFMVCLFVFAWLHGPPALFHRWTREMMPIFVCCFICLPLLTMLPLYLEEKKRSKQLIDKL